MKLFDEKGKLFGKINIIDLLVILVVLVALVVVGMKVLGGGNADEVPPPASPSASAQTTPSATPTPSAKPAETPASTPKPTPTPKATPTPDPKVANKLTYTVRVTAQRKEIAERIAEYVDFAAGKKDQLMFNGTLAANAYVVDFWTEPCRYNVTYDGEMEMISATEAQEAGLVDICLVVESVVPNVITSQVGSQEVRIGKMHILKTSHMEFFNGVIVDCVWEAIEE